MALAQADAARWRLLTARRTHIKFSKRTAMVIMILALASELLRQILPRQFPVLLTFPQLPLVILQPLLFLLLLQTLQPQCLAPTLLPAVRFMSKTRVMVLIRVWQHQVRLILFLLLPPLYQPVPRVMGFKPPLLRQAAEAF